MDDHARDFIDRAQRMQAAVDAMGVGKPRDDLGRRSAGEDVEASDAERSLRLAAEVDRLRAQLLEARRVWNRISLSGDRLSDKPQDLMAMDIALSYPRIMGKQHSGE